MSVRIRSFLLTQVIVRSFLLKEKNQKFKSYPYFWLNPNRVRTFGLTQVIVRSFLLKEKNQKFKAASAELLRLFVSLCAPQTRFAQTATLRPLHSVPPLNSHQNEAGPIDN